MSGVQLLAEGRSLAARLEATGRLVDAATVRDLCKLGAGSPPNGNGVTGPDDLALQLQQAIDALRQIASVRYIGGRDQTKAIAREALVKLGEQKP